MPRQWVPHQLLNGQTVRARTLAALGRGLEQAADQITGDQLPPEVVPDGALRELRGTRGQQTAIDSEINQWRSFANYDDQQFVQYPPAASSDWSEFLVGVSARPSFQFPSGPSGGLFGELVIDSELRPATIQTTVPPRGTNTLFPDGATPWREFGVFVQGRFVATTGRLYQGRETVSIPWFTPSAGGSATVEVRVRSNLGFLDDGVGTVNLRPLVVNGIQLWSCRPLA